MWRKEKRQNSHPGSFCRISRGIAAKKTLGRDIMTLTGVAGVDPSVPASQDDR
jgi:hypothetical protein